MHPFRLEVALCLGSCQILFRRHFANVILINIGPLDAPEVPKLANVTRAYDLHLVTRITKLRREETTAEVDKAGCDAHHK